MDRKKRTCKNKLSHPHECNHPDVKGNIRDHATITELICLSNLENINAVLIADGISQSERLEKLNLTAIHQMQVLESSQTEKTEAPLRLCNP